MSTNLNGSYIYTKNETDIEALFDPKTKAWIIEDKDTDVARKFDFDDATQQSTDNLIGFDVTLTCISDVTNYSFNEKKNKFNESNIGTKFKITVLTHDESMESTFRENTLAGITQEDVLKNSVIGSFNPNFYIKVKKLNFYKSDGDSINKRMTLLAKTVDENKQAVDASEKFDTNISKRLKERLDKALNKSKANLQAIVG